MRRSSRRRPWAGMAWWKTSRTCPVKVGDFDTDVCLICREGLTEAFLLTWGEPVARGAQKIADLGRGGRLCVRGDRSCLAGRGDGIDGVGQALLAWRREHEGGSDARVEQACPGGVPVKIKQSRIGEDAHDQVGVRGPGEFVDNGGVGVGQAQCRKARTGHEARVGRADDGSRQVVVTVVVVLDGSPAECVVSCARVVVGAVGAFRGEAAFKGFAQRFGQERPGDGGGRRESVRVKCGDAWRRPVVSGEDAELFIGEASRRGGVFALVGSGCSVRSRRLARVRASGVSASFRDEAVAGVVIVCLSTQQPCGCSTSVKRYGGATRRRWRRFPGQSRPRRRSAAMRAVATKSLVIWPRVCWPEGCFRPLAIRYDIFPGHRGATRRAVRKHRAPNGALRRPGEVSVSVTVNLSESTEHQTVH